MKRQIRVILVQICCFLAYRSGFLAFMRRFFPNRGVRILYFHQVSGRRLEACLRYIQRRYTILSLDELVDGLKTGAKLPDFGVVLTFDDGYQSNYWENLPVLKRFGVPCTGFLTAEMIGTDRVFWWDQLIRSFEQTSKKEWYLRGERFSLVGKVKRQKALAAALAYIKGIDEAEKQGELDGVVRELGMDGVEISASDENRLMDWDQVRQMADEGVVMGGHTLNHAILSRCSGEEKRRQAGQCKAMIEREIGREVRHFAYPNGRREDYDAESEAVLRELGYDSAVTTERGIVRAGANRYALPRKPITEHVTVAVLAMTLSGLTGRIPFEY